MLDFASEDVHVVDPERLCCETGCALRAIVLGEHNVKTTRDNVV